MKTLKTILQSEASKIVHIAILLGLYIEIEKSIVVMLFFGFEILFLFRKSKNLLMIGLVLITLFQVRQFFIQRPIINQTQTNIKGTVKEVGTSSIVIRAGNERIIVYGIGENKFLPGDKIQILGRFFESDFRQVEHNFDYKTTLLSRKITSQFYMTDFTITGHTFHLREIQTLLARWMDIQFSKDITPYLKMFVLGVDDDVDPSELETFRELGISHLFAISGMHVGMILFFVHLVLSLFYLKETTEKGITFTVLFVYNVITGFSISIIRASILFVLIFINRKKEWFFTKTDLLSFIFVGFIFYEPLLLEQAGFQLSFFITFAILLSLPLLKEKSFFSKLIIVQTIATLFSLPILLELNGKYGLISLFSSTFFLGLITIFLLPGSFLLLLVPKLEKFYQSAIQIFKHFIGLFDQSNPLVIFQFPRLEYVFLYYIGVFWLMSNLIQKKKGASALGLIAYAIVLSLLHPMNPMISKVVFLDIGQGDSIYIQSKGCNILLDTGPRDDYDTVIHYLLGENVSRLDAVFISHFHEDHYGELDDILSTFHVEHVFASHIDDASQRIEVLSLNDSFICKGIHLEVVHAYTGNSNENNNSLVLYGTIGWDRYLFMGDVERTEEIALIDKIDENVDILKVSHHGSDTSTTEEFLSSINLGMAIISVGSNRFGHPSEKTLSALKTHDIPFFETSHWGSISIVYHHLFHYRTIKSFIHRISFLNRRLPVYIKDDFHLLFSSSKCYNTVGDQLGEFSLSSLRKRQLFTKSSNRKNLERTSDFKRRHRDI